MIILDNKEREEMEDTGMCINCGREISPNMAQCEYCGYCYPSEISIDDEDAINYLKMKQRRRK